MRYQLPLITILLASCGDPCLVDIDDASCPECTPVEMGHPYGPCDPETGCGGPGSICYAPTQEANVCAKTCLSDEDCGAVEYCTPDSAPAACSPWGWCVVTCGAADGACPDGMACDLDIEGAAGLGICTWPVVQKREAPDVPWPSVEMAGTLKSPASVADLLVQCFGEVDYSQAPGFTYEDQAPDGDDQQSGMLCVGWTAHLDRADCMRSGLLDLGGTASP